MARQPQGQRSRWLKILSIVSLLVGAVALVWLVDHIGLAALRDGLTQVGWAFALMCGAHLVTLFASALTLRYCAGRDGNAVGFGAYLRATLAGHAINEATPLGKLGEITKFTLLSEQMPQARAASALILHNFITFILACVKVAIAPLVAWLWFDVSPALEVTLLVTAIVFAVIGVAAFLLFWFGVGQWPFALLRRLRVPPRRLERWQAKWQHVADEWQEAAHDRAMMVRAFALNLVSRVIALFEPWLALYLLGVDNALAAALLASANYQVVFWLTSFVPMQAGTAEAGAYGLFTGLGLPTGAGVLLEILRKLRRVTFIGVGVAVLGWSNFRALARDARARRRGPAAATGRS